MSLKKILIKRGSKIDLPTLLPGELGFCEDTKELFIGSSTGNRNITDAYTKEEIDNLLAELDSHVYIEITYADLVALRNNSQLVPGCQYRITDYETTTIQEESRSAGHLFDVVVLALTNNKLAEAAWAIQSDRDDYFDNVKVEAWKLKYCLDNDTDRFAWADEVNGKGVIYRMIDEFNNDVPYDFKNIQFKRDGVYYFTFTWITADNTIWDASIHPELTNDEGKGSRVFDNIISSAKDYSYILNDSVFIADYDYDDGFLYGWYSNTVGNNFISNTIGDDFVGNTIGDDFSNNTIGDDFVGNTIGNDFSNNTIGDDFYNNTIGNLFYNNTIGDNFSNNTIGNNFSNNTIGNDFYYNTIGNNFISNTIGDDFSNNTIGDDFVGNTIGNDVQYIQFSVDGTSNNLIRYLYLKNGLSGASSNNQLDLYYAGLYNRQYSTTFEIIANGNIVSSWEETPLTRAGKVKATKTTATWSDI